MFPSEFWFPFFSQSQTLYIQIIRQCVEVFYFLLIYIFNKYLFKYIILGITILCLKNRELRNSGTRFILYLVLGYNFAVVVSDGAGVSYGGYGFLY